MWEGYLADDIPLTLFRPDPFFFGASMMRAALYHRCSTIDQNPALAREELRAGAERMGYKVVLEIEETGSGANNDRPGLQKLLSEASRGKFSAVFVWKLDRFGRSALDLLANIQDLSLNKVRFIALTQGIDIRPQGDGGDPMGKLLLTMLAAVAEFERDLIRERTKLGITRAKANGKQLGRPRAASDSQVEKIRTLRNAGQSWKTISKAVRLPMTTVRRAVS